MEWFYAAGSERVGPFSDAQMAALVRSGAVAKETLVWREGMDSWLPAGGAFPEPHASPHPVLPPIPGTGSSRPSVPLSRGGERPAAAPSDFSPGEILGRVRAHWALLSLRQKVATLVAAVSVLVAWQLAGAWQGYALLISALATVLGVALLTREPVRGRQTALWGATATGLMSLWAMLDAVHAWRISTATDDLSRSDVQARAVLLLVGALAVGYCLRRKGDPRPASLAPGAGPGEGEGRAAGTPPVGSGMSGPPVQTGKPALPEAYASSDEPGPVAPSAWGLDEAAPEETSTSPASLRTDASQAHARRPFGDSRHARRRGAGFGLRGESEGKPWGIRVGIALAAVTVLAVAGWGGVAAYQNAQLAESRVEALQISVGLAREVASALRAGERAVEARDHGSRLNKVFGPQGAERVRQLADAYTRYESASGTLRREVEDKRAELDRLERRASSARGDLDRFERRTFMVGRQFDRSSSGAGMYEAVDLSSYGRVVLKISDEAAAEVAPGRRVDLYVASEGRQAVTVTRSNAYRAYDVTEYYPVFRVEGAAGQVERLLREIEGDLYSVRATLSQMETRLQATVGVAADDYWTAVQPVLTSLQARD